MENKKRENPPRDGCKGYKDPYTGEFECEYDTPFVCEECMYCSWNRAKYSKGSVFVGKNPQAKKYNKD
jgi:hypothetical protein